jgi:hypothetical protein
MNENIGDTFQLNTNSFILEPFNWTYQGNGSNLEEIFIVVLTSFFYDYLMVPYIGQPSFDVFQACFPK